MSAPYYSDDAVTTTPDPQDLERALAAAWESKGTTLTWKQVCDSENPNIMQVRRGLVRQVTAAIAAMTPTPDVDVLAEIRKAEREVIAAWHESRADELRFVAARYFRLGQREAGKITEAELQTHRISAIGIRNGEHEGYYPND